MTEESQVSWKVWVVISMVTAGLTPVAIEVVPPIAAAISRHWNPIRCVASVNHPSTPLMIHQAPDGARVGSIWAQHEAQVTVVDEREGWYRVSAPEKGWVRGDRITAACLNGF
jgi:hypothetical protein